MNDVLMRLLMLMVLPFSAKSQSLAFKAGQINPIMHGYQRAHYCSPYRLPVVERASSRYIGDDPEDGTSTLTGEPLEVAPSGTGNTASKYGLVEMWAEDSRLCDLAKHRNTFYDSVWRDAIRFEAVVNYKAYFGPDLPVGIDLSDYAIDDGIVSKEMMALLTKDTASTFGAQNDDVMWWALAFLRAYEYEPSHGAYLKAAKAVFDRMRHTPEQRVCGGGITWGEGTHYKNAITNALYLDLAVRLAGLSSSHSPERRRYLMAAITQADWLVDRSGLWIVGGLLADGVHFRGDRCSERLDPTVWTYSQGVAINGLAQLTLLTGRSKYADRAQMLLLRVLDSSQLPKIVNRLGLLEEPSASSSKADEDAQTFKGIFVEHVAYALFYFSKADPLRYASGIEGGKVLLTTNANVVWRTGRRQDGRTDFPFEWSDSGKDTPYAGNMRTTAAAIDLFNAAWSIRQLR